MLRTYPQRRNIGANVSSRAKGSGNTTRQTRLQTYANRQKVANLSDLGYDPRKQPHRCNHVRQCVLTHAKDAAPRQLNKDRQVAKGYRHK